MVQGCTHTKQTFWTEDQFVLTVSPGIRDRDTRVVEIVMRELQKTKPGKWGWVRPGHFWVLKFGKVPGTMNCVEKVFKVGTRKYEKYKGVRFGEDDSTLVVDV